MGRRFKTGTVARQLGITAPLLRMWQARYAFVDPRRGPGGQRLYSEDDVGFLGAIRTLVDRGYAIGELASWTRRDVLRAAGVSATPKARPEAEHEPTTIAMTLDRGGRIEVISPNVEALLGWAHGLLIGQPIWGICLDIPDELVQLVHGEVREKVAKPANVFWVWVRARSGAPVPCRVECSASRKATEPTTLTITPLAASGRDALSQLFATVERERIGPGPASAESLMKGWAEHAITEHRAALARAWLYSAQDNTLRLVASAGLSRAIHTSSRAAIRLATYPYKVGVVARTGIPFLLNGLEGERDFDMKWIRREQLLSAAAMPLTAGGVLFGVTVEFFRHRLGSEDIGRIQAAATLHGGTLERLSARLEVPGARSA